MSNTLTVSLLYSSYGQVTIELSGISSYGDSATNLYYISGPPSNSVGNQEVFYGQNQITLYNLDPSSTYEIYSYENYAMEVSNSIYVTPNGAGGGGGSNTLSVSLSSKTNNMIAVNLSGTSSSFQSAYMVYYFDLSNYTTNTINTNGASYIEITGLLPNTTYEIFSEAFGGDGSQQSNIIYVTTNLPLTLTLDFKTSTSISLFVTGTSSSGQSADVVYYKRASQVSYSQATPEYGAVLLTSLIPGTTYNIYSAYSVTNETSSTINIDTLYVNTLTISLISKTSTTITLSYTGTDSTNSSAGTIYRVPFSSNSPGDILSGPSIEATATMTFTELTPTTTYSFIVDATNSTDYSNPLQVTTLASIQTINSITDWNNYGNTYNNISTSYLLNTSLNFSDTSFSNIYMLSGCSFDGQYNKIYINNINSFNGLFNLNSGSTTTTIKNLKIICSNITLNDGKGILVDGSINGSIVSNGIISNVSVILKNSNIGSNCGGIVGASARSINLYNCSFDVGIFGSFSSNNGGGLIGPNSGNIVSAPTANLSIFDSWVKGIISNSTGGLIGNTSNINIVKDCYFLGTASNNNGIKLNNTNISQLINTISQSDMNIIQPYNIISSNIYFGSNNISTLGTVFASVFSGNISALSNNISTSGNISGNNIITNTLISTSSTTNSLVVSGNVNISSNLIVGNINLGGNNITLGGSLGLNGINILTTVTSGPKDHYAIGESNTNNAFFKWTRVLSGTSYAEISTYSGSNPLIFQADGGNVGIGTTSANGKLQLGNDVVNRKIVLYDTNNNQHQYFGFGINNGILRYQTDTTTSHHVFYAATNSTSSTELMRITGTGNVGIGTSSANGKLQFGNNNTNRKIVLHDGFNNEHQFFGFGVNSGVLRYQLDTTTSSHVFYAGTGSTTSNELMRITGTGNICIGTTSSNADLHISRSGIARLICESTNSHSAIVVTSNNNFAELGVAFGNSEYSTDAVAGDAILRSNLGKKLLLQANGGGASAICISGTNVGIGTTTPINILQVGSGGRLRISNNNSDYSLIGSNNSDGNENTRIVISGINRSGHNGKIEYVGCGVSSSHIWFNNSIEQMRFTASGYLGIGTTTPLCPLDVRGSATLSGTSVGNGGDTTLTSFLDNGSTLSSIGTTTSSIPFSIIATNNIGALAYYANSDRRIKGNIILIDDQQSLTKLRLIEPKKYQYIDKISRGNMEVFGFIAQEVRSIFPEATILSTDFIPDVYTIKEYNQLSGNLIEISNLSITANIGDKYKLIQYDNSILEGNIININGNSITFILDKDFIPPSDPNIVATVGSNLFVYGKQVSDFHNLNKDYLFTINYAATQELDRIIDWHCNGTDRTVTGNAINIYGNSLNNKIQLLEGIINQQQQTINNLQQQITNILSRLTVANI